MAAVIQEIPSRQRLDRQPSMLEKKRTDKEHDELHLEKGLMASFLKVEKGFKDLPWFPHENYVYHDVDHNVNVHYKLSFPQRVFVMMEQHDSSFLSMIIASVVTTCIIVGCVCFILAEEKEFLVSHHNHCSDYEAVCDDQEIKYLECSSSHRRRLAGGDDDDLGCAAASDDDHRRLASSDSTCYLETCDPSHPLGGYVSISDDDDGMADYATAGYDKIWYCPCVVDKDNQYCPGVKICPPHHSLVLETIESVCMFIFTLEYIVLLVTVPFAPSRLAHTMPHSWDHEHHFHKPDPIYPVWYQMCKFFTSWKMLIDLATLLPFFILLRANPVFYPNSYGEVAAGSFAFIRVFRLLRILHIFKIQRKNKILALVERTMKLSAPTMVLTGYITVIHMVFWGSLIHFFENQEWRSGHDSETFAEFPEGAYMRRSHYGYWEPSPFNSIATGIYWVIMISTTTGVGDTLQPTTDGGRFCAACVCCIGVILMAIPIGVVGLNFSTEWEKMKLKFVTTAELGPVSNIRMNAETAVHINALGDEETGGEETESPGEQLQRELEEMNEQLSSSLNKVIEGQRSLSASHEELGEFLSKLTSRIARNEK